MVTIKQLYSFSNVATSSFRNWMWGIEYFIYVKFNRNLLFMAYGDWLKLSKFCDKFETIITKAKDKRLNWRDIVLSHKNLIDL